MILLGRGLEPRHTQAHMGPAPPFMVHVHKRLDVNFCLQQTCSVNTP